MTNQEKLIKFAEHQGYVFSPPNRSWPNPYWVRPSDKGLVTFVELPKYNLDLNIIAEIEKGLSEEQSEKYITFLIQTAFKGHTCSHQIITKIDVAKAMLKLNKQQRFNALGRVFGLWEE